MIYASIFVMRIYKYDAVFFVIVTPQSSGFQTRLTMFLSAIRYIAAELDPFAVSERLIIVRGCAIIALSMSLLLYAFFCCCVAVSGKLQDP